MMNSYQLFVVSCQAYMLGSDQPRHVSGYQLPFTYSILCASAPLRPQTNYLSLLHG